MSIGENVKRLRKEKGLTQRTVANDLFMTAQLLCAIETGIKQPSLNVALALAKYFGVSVEELAGRTEKC